MTLGQRIKSMRKERGLSQGDVEHRTGLLRCYVSRVESGRITPSVETLFKMAAALDTSLFDLMRGVSMRGDPPTAMVASLRGYVLEMSSESRTAFLIFLQALAAIPQKQRVGEKGGETEKEVPDV